MEIDSKDLQWVLALVRGRSLPEAAQRLGVDPSSVYRGIKRIEKQLGRSLFDRSAQGMAATELALQLAERGAAIEAELQAAQELLQDERAALTGTLRITTNDVMLHGLLLPALAGWRALHPRLELELVASNELARLDRREADIALRGTLAPPEHLIGAKLGILRAALWAHRSYLARLPAGTPIEAMDWVAPDADSAMPEHPSKRWRRGAYPTVQPVLHVDSLLAAAQAIEAGVAIGVAPYFLMQGKPDLVDLSGPLDSVAPECWLLTHPDLRGLRRITAFFDYARRAITLP